MSGAAAASNRLTMFSAFISLDGVTFGGGGTAGFSWTGRKHRACRQVFVIQPNIWFVLVFSYRKTTARYLGWRFGDRRWSSGPEGVVGCFFDTEEMQTCQGR